MRSDDARFVIWTWLYSPLLPRACFPTKTVFCVVWTKSSSIFSICGLISAMCHVLPHHLQLWATHNSLRTAVLICFQVWDGPKHSTYRCSCLS